MPKLIERRRKPRRKASHVSGPAWVMLENVQGARADIRAKVVDFNETGIRIHVSLPLRVNHVIVVKGQAQEIIPDGRATARVVDCRALAGSGYTAGLTFEDASDADQAPLMDHYEALQVSPKADSQTIHRVYRLQAQRYHPDNRETGDAKLFQAIAEAYEVLSDPAKRAAYDVQLERERTVRWRAFDQRETTSGKIAEKILRRSLLELLYAARRKQPRNAWMSIQEIEEALGCRSEYLEFGLWYLLENGLVTQSAEQEFSITPTGVDHVEAVEPERQNTPLLASGE